VSLIHRRGLRRLAVLLLSATMALSLTVSAEAKKPATPGKGAERTVTVMTRNLYFGADLTPVVVAPDLPAFIGAVTAAWIDAHGTDFPGRMGAVADEIVAAGPTLVGLQEVALWRTGPLGDPAPATTVDADFLGLLLDALDARGAAYEVVAHAEGFDVEFPVVPLGFDGRLTVSDVLLARTDLPTSQLKLSNPQTGSYATVFSLPSPAGVIPFPRQWASVDAKVRGKEFRFVTTHLEAVFPPVRVAQAAELVAAHAATKLPVVFVGDFNSEPGTAGDAAWTMIQSGATDVWGALYPGDPGLTCCFDGLVADPDATLGSRIDLVLAEAGFGFVSAEVVGEEAGDFFGRWPSDHAGVVATLTVDHKRPSKRR
jgi:hypothetical protein